MKKGVFLIGMVGLIGFTSCKKQECKRLKESYEEARMKADNCTEIEYDNDGNPYFIYKDCFSTWEDNARIRSQNYLDKCSDDI